MIIESVKENDFHPDTYELLTETIFNNPYCKFKPYRKQAYPILYACMPEQYHSDGTLKPNEVLSGGGGYGGKTYLASMLAVQYLQAPDYTCLVTRRNYAELLDTDSVWDNLLDWCCGEHLPEELRCEFKKSPTPQIIAPNGNTIYFKAFDRDEKKQKFKSASYDRIINDEASELPEAVLKFQHRSSRNTSLIPRSIINLSNPGGESTDYLVENFVDGPKPYFQMDWRDNPFIDKAAYEGSLNELDYIDQQYQKFGNWHYKPSSGELICRDELISAKIDYEDYNELTPLYNVVAVDKAGAGRDNTAAVSLTLFNNGRMIVTGLVVDPTPYPEQTIYNFVEEQSDKWQTYIIDLEDEPGSDSLYSLRHWQDELADITFPKGIIVQGISSPHSKFNRARPVAHEIKRGNLYFDSSLDLENQNGLFDQFIYITPDRELMKKKKSPDELDALGYAYMELKSMMRGGVTVR